MKTKLLLGFSLLFCTSLIFSQVTFSGNGNSGFGGPIGGSTLEINDDGTTITFTLTKGAGDFNDALVLYLDTKTGGRNVIDSQVNDTQDGLRTAISNGDSGGFASVITFPVNFEVDYAIALDQNFAGLWEIPATGTIGANGLNYVNEANLNLSPTGTNTSPTYTFSLDWSNLGLTNTDSFTFVGVYVSTTAYNSDEGFGDGISPGTIAGDAITFTSVLEYPSGNVLSNDGFSRNVANVNFANNKLYLKNLQGQVNIRVFDVLGKLLLEKSVISNTDLYSIPLDLPKNQLHILAVESNNYKKVLKVIAH